MEQHEIYSFKQFYYLHPLFLRTYLPICFLFTILISCGLISPYHIFYTFHQTFLELNVWRPFTALFFFGKLDIDTLFSFYIAYCTFITIEIDDMIAGAHADFLWLVILLFLGCVIFGSLFNLYFYADSFLMALVYINGKRQPFPQLSLLGFLEIKNGLFPYLYAAFMMIKEERIRPYVVGIVLGHCYFFLKFECLGRYKKDYLSTPKWFKNWVDGRRLHGLQWNKNDHHQHQHHHHHNHQHQQHQQHQQHPNHQPQPHQPDQQNQQHQQHQPHQQHHQQHQPHQPHQPHQLHQPHQQQHHLGQ